MVCVDWSLLLNTIVLVCARVTQSRYMSETALDKMQFLAYDDQSGVEASVQQNIKRLKQGPLPIQQSAGYASFRGSQIQRQCYSCMSQLAENYWPALEKTYQPPMTFSDECAHDDNMLPTKPCNTSCVTFRFDMNMAGVSGQLLFIRGCANEISVSGYTNHTNTFIYAPHTHPVCQMFKMIDLFRGHSLSEDEQSVRVCVCAGDRCNAAHTHNEPSLGPTTIHHAASMIIMFTTTSLLWTTQSQLIGLD